MAKNIVFILPQFKLGGGNRVFIELANILADKNFTITLVYPSNSTVYHSYELNSKIKVLSIGHLATTNGQKLWNTIKTLNYVRQNHSADMILISDPISALFSPILRRLHVIRYIQGKDYNLFDDLKLLKHKTFLYLYKALTWFSFRLSHMKYIFNSMYSYDSFLGVSNRSKVGPTIVSPAINHDVFKKQRLSNDERCNLCLVARKHPLKGFQDFVDVWQGLKPIIGDKVENIFIVSHDDLSEFDLSEFAVVKPDNDQELARIYNKSHIFISTSWWEGFGLPALEAMACGCAVITSDSGGADEYALPGKNCLMYEPHNVDSLKKQIMILINRPNLRRKLSNAGVATARKFTWEKSAEKLDHIINNFNVL